MVLLVTLLAASGAWYAIGSVNISGLVPTNFVAAQVIKQRCPVHTSHTLMKTNSEAKLLRAHFWASCAIMFGAGYMVLSQIRHAILVAIVVTLFGALAKLIIQSRLARICQDTTPANSDPGR